MPVPEIVRDMKKELEIIEEHYPGVDVLLNDEAVMRGEFESEHDFQLFVSLERMFAKGFNLDLQEFYNSMFRSNRVGQCL